MASIRQIEQINLPIWQRCQKHDLLLSKHENDPVWLATQLAPLISSGSVLLVAGDDGLSSLIRAVTQSRFSHVGLLITTMTQGEGSMIWQSYMPTPTKANYPSRPDFVPSQMTRWGADLSDLARYLINYWKQEPTARFVLRELRQPLTEREQQSLHDYIDHVFTYPIGYPHPYRLCLLFLRDHYPSLRPLCDFLLGSGSLEKGGEYCSMLVAHSHEMMDLITTTRSLDSYLPGDFSLDLEHQTSQPVYQKTTMPLYDSQELELVFL